jgi:hypothetical protein
VWRRGGPREQAFAAVDLTNATAVDVGQLALELGDAFADEAAVDFELLLARSARSNAAHRPGGRRSAGARDGV